MGIACSNDREDSPNRRDTDRGDTDRRDAASGDAGLADAARPSPYPAGCEVLEERRSERAECGTDEAQCAQAMTDTRQLSYVLRIADEALDADGNTVAVDDDEVERRINCLETWLSEMGLDLETTSSSVIAAGDWQDVEHALWTTIVQSYYPTCVADCGCSGLSEMECEDDAFCASESGRPFDEAGSCWQPTTFAGCYPSSQSCDQAESRAKGEDGQCWWFSSICDVAGFDYDDSKCEELAGDVASECE